MFPRVPAAQGVTGALIGTVKDAQGGVVPGATVTLIDEARGTKLAPATTNEAGASLLREFISSKIFARVAEALNVPRLNLNAAASQLACAAFRSVSF